MVSIGDLKLFPCDVGSVDGSYLILKEGDSMTYFNGTKSAETTYTLTNENVFSMDAAGVTMWGAYLNGGIVLTVPLQIFGGDDDAPDMMFYYAKEGSDASLALVAQLLKAGPMKDQLAAMDSVELAQLEEYYAWLFGDSSTATTQSKTSSAPAESEDLTLEEKNAVKQAQNYLNVSAFSYSGLIDQLEYEGYSTEAATKAVDSLDVDWMEQAAKKAESYMSISAFSRSGLINQLEYEGFSAAEAEYGAAAVGY
ncbi:MAG: Ltp family lipoprotein [Oscillospiraceae bacterium]|nr:Ltp family lipoprotein [Oscillospiraceae bacterium]